MRIFAINCNFLLKIKLFSLESEIKFTIAFTFARVTIQQLGSSLSSQRKALRLSQAYVAELAGISKRQLLEWEAGRGNPGFTQLQAVLEVLGLSLLVQPKAL